MSQRRVRRNPLQPGTWLPRTGNPYLDGQVDAAIGRAGAAVLDAMNPQLREAVATIAGAMRGVNANPAGRQDTAQAHGPQPHGDRDRFIQELLALDGGLLMTLGRRGSGKTALDLRLAEEYHQRRGWPVYVIGMPQQVLTRFGFKALPPECLGKLPNNAIVVIDDVALFFSNRNYAQAGLLHTAIAESRHRHVILIVNAHNSALVDKYLFEANVLFLKPSSGMNDDLQRSGIRRLALRSEAAFKGLDRDAAKALVYAYSDELTFEGLLAYNPPTGWSRQVSEHHRMRSTRAAPQD